MDTFTLSKELGLTPKRATSEKPLYYKGIHSNNKLVKCTLIALVSEKPMIVKVDVNGICCNIALDRLREIQPTKTALAKMNERPNKGKSLFKFPDSFTVVDLETTGLCSKTDLIIELAAIKIKDLKITNTFEELVNPQIKIPYEIQNLTNITDAMVVSADSIEKLLPSFLDFLGNDIIIGHNINFDINFIYDNCERLGFPAFTNNFVDTLKLSRKLYPNWERHRLCDMAQKLNITQTAYHRALADCETAFLCYKEMKNYYMSSLEK